MNQWSSQEVILLLEKYPEYARQGKPLYALTDVLPERSAASIDHKIRDLRSKGAVGSYSDYYVPPENVVVSNQIKSEIKESGILTVESPRSDQIISLEALLVAAQVDEDLWQVDRYIINKWEVGAKDNDGNVVVTPLVQVKAWLSPNIGMMVAQAVSRQAIYEQISDSAPTVPSVHISRDSTYMIEMGLFDLHLGKYAWDEETGDPYNMDIAEKVYKNAVLDLIDQAVRYTGSQKLSHILFPIGNDFLHVDNRNMQTSHGTSLADSADAGTWQQLVLRAYSLLRWSVDTLSTYAPVKVVVVPGNHDQESSWYLGELLDAWYRHTEDVSVDNSAALRKYHAFGNTLIGFTHGVHEKVNSLPMVMATEVPEMWGASTYREIHIGHVHYRKALSYQTEGESEGVMVRILPSLSGTDSWHHKKGYVAGLKSAEAYVYSDKRGLSAVFHYNELPKGSGFLTD